MGGDLNKNATDAPENSPVETVSAQDKKAPIIVFVLVCIIATTAYFIYLNSNISKVSISITSPSKDGGGMQQKPMIQTNVGSPVDHATYLQIQSLMQKTRFSKPEVVESSLRAFDIDNDGDQDVLGFLKRTNYFFSTWHRNGTEFDYYEDTYNDFRLSEKYDGLSCSIDDLAVGRVTLACAQLGQEYLTTLRYQKNGVGYYRDVDAHIVTFDTNTSWSEYISKKGGIQFKYPPDVQISEKTYAVYDDLITIITAKRGSKILFEIKTVPQKDDGGGGVIYLAQKTIFLKLLDDSYLSRNWMGGESASQELGVFYDRANAYKENNVGDTFASNDAANIHNNKKYTLFTPLTSENILKEIDTIFASIKYIETPATEDAEIISLQSSPISLGNVVTLEVPGYVTERQPATESGALEEKDLAVIFINSPIYQPSSLNLKLLPFGSIGKINAIGGGGYDVAKNSCFGFEKDIVTPTEKIGVNQVCSFGFGDAGFSSEGYYILDPKRKYIVSVTQDGEYSDHYETLDPDLKNIVESVRFSTQ